jgi:lysozyme family protein
MLTPNYDELWKTMVVDPHFSEKITEEATSIISNKSRYQHVATSCNPHMPWYFVGIIHLMECSLNFRTHLYNGDPLTARTVRYPRGRPTTGTPPFDWEFAAIDALLYEGYGKPQGYGIDDILRELEEYNGRGYWSKDIYTPYLWSRTNHYTAGKFIEVLNPQTQHYDVHYDPKLVSGQLGAAPILKALIDADTKQSTPVLPVSQPDPGPAFN